MKKILKVLTITALSLVMLFGMSMTVLAAGASLTANTNTVRPGDTITLSLKVSHPGSMGLTGTLEYDASQVTLSGDPATGLDGWLVERAGNDLVIYDNNQTNPLKDNETVITMKFVVNADLAEGTQINISVNNLVSSDGSADTEIGKVTYSTTIARKLSSNANLATLSVTGATFVPGFNPAVTIYDLGSVEYNVTKLDIKCTTQDPNATYKFRFNYLDVGNNAVYVDVTAEDGSTKTYKMTVIRKQNPNYVASGNANLKAITVSQGAISPKFAENTTDYIVYLPYESIGTSFTANGTKADTKAIGVTAGKIDKLVEGKNQTTVVCKAENGTEKTYNITVFVMPKYDGSIPNIGENGGNDPGQNNPDTEQPGTENTEEPKDTEQTTQPEEDDSEDDKNTSNGSGAKKGGFVTVLVIIFVLILVAALFYVLFPKKK